MKKNSHLILLSLALLSTLNPQLSTCLAQGTAFTYQGRLTSGTNAASGIYDLRFTVYDSSSGAGLVAGPLTNSPVAVSNGLFTVTLDFGAGVFTGADRWLEIGVRTNGGGAFTTLSPRQKLTPTPYALYAPNAGVATTAAVVTADAVATTGLQDGAVTGAKIASGTIAAGNVNAATFAGTFWQATGNAGTTPGTHFLGTTDQQALELKVRNWRGLRLEPAPEDGLHSGIVNVIGGSPANSVGPGVFGATIAGGGAVLNQGTDSTNRVAASFATVGGGRGNQIGAASDGSTIAGGYDNRIGTNCYNSLIAGGSDNAIEDSTDWSSIASGVNNSIRTASDWSAVGGGRENHIGPDSLSSVVGGGQVNEIGKESFSSTIAGGIGGKIAVGGGLFTSGSDHCTIGGGYYNRIGRDGLHNTIAGGYQNNIDDNAHSSTIGGGHDNQVFLYADGATIGGGGLNTNGGYFCTIPGGRGNAVSGSYSLAAGQNAKANHTRSFVWSSRPSPAPSFSADRFHVHATEGLSVDYAGQRPDGGGNQWIVLGGFSDFPGQTISTWTGARLTDGGVWTDNSDRNAKENFKPVDSREVLERVAALPVQEWNYKTEGPDVRHIGPVAQDFYAAFRTGADDKHLAALDSAGVALAAIQGLNEKLEEQLRQKEAQLESQQEQITELLHRLGVLEKKLTTSETK
jgi:hypothetical protein